MTLTGRLQIASFLCLELTTKFDGVEHSAWNGNLNRAERVALSLARSIHKPFGFGEGTISCWLGAGTIGSRQNGVVRRFRSRLAYAGASD